MSRHSSPSLEKWLMLSAICLAYFFVNFATFASLGVVLFTMAGELKWSMTAAGFSFALLGLACGLSSTLPTMTMKYIGGRGSTVIGAALFVVGCLLASASHSLIVFDVAIAMLGAGYTFAGNVPGVILIAQWFRRGSARIVGIYLMIGALGAAAAPPAAQLVVGAAGWRGYWQVLAAAAVIVGILCLAFVRDRSESAASAAEANEANKAESGEVWTPRQAMRTWQFVVLTAELVFTMTAVTTINSMLVTHLAKLGIPAIAGASALGVLSFTATLLKGATGHLCETRSPKFFVILGLLCQAIGCALFVNATGTVVIFAAAIVFGAGWAFALVGGWVVLMRYFGGATGARLLATVQLVTTVGAAGPISAGMVADRWGTYSPIFMVYAAVLFLLVMPIVLMRRPGLPGVVENAPYSAVAVTPG